jgi:hypothetical protein
LKLVRVEVRRETPTGADCLIALKYGGIAGDRPSGDDPNRSPVRSEHIPFRKHLVTGKDLDAETVTASPGANQLPVIPGPMENADASKLGR